MLHFSYRGTLFKYANVFYLIYALGLRVPFEILNGLGLISFNYFNLIWYALSLIFIVIHFYFNNFYLKSKKCFFLLVAFIFSCLLSYVSILYHYFSLSLPSQEFKTMYLGYIFSSYSYFCTGIVAFYLSANFNYSRFNYISIPLVLAILPIFIISDYETFSIPVRALFDDVGVNYLLFGDLISFSFFVYVFSILSSRYENQSHRSGIVKLSFFSNYFFIFFVFVVVIFSLYLNGSRTSFVIFVFTSVLLFFYLNAKLNLKFIVFLLISVYVFVLFSFYFSNFNINYSEFADSRMLSILFSRTEDGSLIARGQIKYFGFQRIKDNFFQGDLGGQIIHPYGGSPLGSYIHNFLSYLAQFGFGVFIIYFSSWLLLLFYMLKYSDGSVKFALSIVMFAILSVLFSRAFVHTIFFAYWSFSFSVLYNRFLTFGRYK